MALTSILALTMSACALTHEPYGDHLGMERINHDELAQGSVATLLSLYPPAKTRLALQQKADDPFGAALLKRLRENGYAVDETVRKEKEEKPSVPRDTDPPRPQPKPEKAKPVTSDPNALPLRYLLSPSGQDLYHLTLMIGTQSLARPYLMQDGRLVAAGAWIRKE